MLFATVAAVDILNIPALTALVGGIVVVFGRILAGLVVFAVGLFWRILPLTSLPALAIAKRGFWDKSHALPLSPWCQPWHYNR